MSDDMTLDEIEGRLDELRAEKEQASEHTAAYGEMFDAVDEVIAHPMTDDEAAGKLQLLKSSLQLVSRDNDPGRGIRWEREQLRKKRWEKRHEEAEGE